MRTYPFPMPSGQLAEAAAQQAADQALAQLPPPNTAVPSNFTTAARFSAYWIVITGVVADPGAARSLCASQGMAFIKRLQRRLGGLSETGAWDQATADALAASVQRTDVQAQIDAGGSFSTVNNQLHQDAAAHAISPLTLRYALWFAYLRQTGHPIESVVIPTGTVFPRFGQAADNDGAAGASDGGATCWAIETPTVPTPAPVPATGMSRKAVGAIALIAGVAVGAGAIWMWRKPRQNPYAPIPY